MACRFVHAHNSPFDQLPKDISLLIYDLLPRSSRKLMCIVDQRIHIMKVKLSDLCCAAAYDGYSNIFNWGIASISSNSAIPPRLVENSLSSPNRDIQLWAIQKCRDNPQLKRTLYPPMGVDIVNELFIEGWTLSKTFDIVSISTQGHYDCLDWMKLKKIPISMARTISISVERGDLVAIVKLASLTSGACFRHLKHSSFAKMFDNHPHLFSVLNPMLRKREDYNDLLTIRSLDVVPASPVSPEDSKYTHETYHSVIKCGRFIDVERFYCNAKRDLLHSMTLLRQCEKCSDKVIRRFRPDVATKYIPAIPFKPTLVEHLKVLEFLISQDFKVNNDQFQKIYAKLGVRARMYLIENKLFVPELENAFTNMEFKLLTAHLRKFTVKELVDKWKFGNNRFHHIIALILEVLPKDVIDRGLSKVALSAVNDNENVDEIENDD